MIKILGHRGVMGDSARPENSLAALEEGLRQGDGIETDISASADGTAWIAHDVTVRYVPYVFTRSRYMLDDLLDAPSRRRVAGKRIEQMTDAEIAALRRPGGGSLPRLSDLFALAAGHPGKIFNLELKGAGAADAALRAIHTAVAAGQVRREQIIITSFDIDALQHVRAREPGLACGLIVLPRGTKAARIYPWDKGNATLYRDFSRTTLDSEKVRLLCPDFIIARGADAADIATLTAALPRARLILWSRDEDALAAAANNPAARPHIAAMIGSQPAQLAPRIIK
jgi:glycerophosphoryl diester phosphodiesterase